MQGWNVEFQTQHLGPQDHRTLKSKIVAIGLRIQRRKSINSSQIEMSVLNKVESLKLSLLWTSPTERNKIFFFVNEIFLLLIFPFFQLVTISNVTFSTTRNVNHIICFKTQRVNARKVGTNWKMGRVTPRKRLLAYKSPQELISNLS